MTDDGQQMAADQHQEKAEALLQVARLEMRRDYPKATMLATLATAHAAMAQAIRSGQ